LVDTILAQTNGDRQMTSKERLPAIDMPVADWLLNTGTGIRPALQATIDSGY
jgi:hypothetical protein